MTVEYKITLTVDDEVVYTNRTSVAEVARMYLVDAEDAEDRLRDPEKNDVSALEQLNRIISDVSCSGVSYMERKQCACGNDAMHNSDFCKECI